MIRLVIKYPNSDDAHFDFDYYLETHIPLSQQLLGDYGIGHLEVLRCEEALSGGATEYVCITQIEFTSVEDLRAGLSEHGEALSGDFARYTNISPVATICEPIGRG